MDVRIRRWLAAVAAVMLTAGCTNDGASPPPDAPRSPTQTPTQSIRLDDVNVSGNALDDRVGLYVCGNSLVASPPATFVEANSFVVFDPETGKGDITYVQLPEASSFQPNARWLLTTQCVDSRRGPLVLVAYQERPLQENGGEGIRAAYTLQGKRLWVREDLNRPADVIDGLIVLGAVPEQPELIVDATTGENLARFGSQLQMRTVLRHRRMVVRDVAPRPVLTNLQGRKIARLDPAQFFSADGRFVFGVNPGPLIDPDTGEPVEEPDGEEAEEEATTDPRSEATQQDEAPPLQPGDVTAYRADNGRRVWSHAIESDPLGQPKVEPETGVVVVVDNEYVVHGLNPRTGAELWEAPTEVESPRVTAAMGLVLLDKPKEGYQLLLDARTGLPLPEPEEPIVDLTSAGALMFVDDLPRLVPASVLRNPPTEDPEEAESEPAN